MAFIPEFIKLHIKPLTLATLLSIRDAAAAEYLVNPTCIEKYRMQVQNHREYLKRLDSVIKCLFPDYWNKSCISGFAHPSIPRAIIGSHIEYADQLDRELYTLAARPVLLEITVAPTKLTQTHSKRARTESSVAAPVVDTSTTTGFMADALITGTDVSQPTA